MEVECSWSPRPLVTSSCVSPQDEMEITGLAAAPGGGAMSALVGEVARELLAACAAPAPAPADALARAAAAAADDHAQDHLAVNLLE